MISIAWTTLTTRTKARFVVGEAFTLLTAITRTWATGGCRGLQIGYEHTFVHQVADFLKSLETGEPCAPTFRDALETQRVCDAVLKSATSKSWEKV